MRKLVLALLLLAACTAGHPDAASPLERAVRNGDTKTIAALIAQGADPNAVSGRNDWTPLLHAVHKNQIGSVRALLDAGADVNRAAPNRLTPLMMAAGYDNRPMVELLLSRGANPAARDLDDFVALDYALTGFTDIDSFTFFGCHPGTVGVLSRVSPPPQRSSTRWATMKGC